MSTTTLTSKGRITLSKTIRDRLALKQGDRFTLGVTSDGTVTLKRERPATIERAYGMLHRLVHRRVKARAAIKDVSIASHRLREIRKSLDRPTRREILERLQERPVRQLKRSARDVIRAERDK